ncbi:glycosyl transferase [Ruminococcus sp. OA3]|uniref:MGDG synthase family glycosyltransferase n=1 Tax=Ruminococcus sp. OA3 TaxID=2914164 RepID=UPI001F05270E|nr:glycosyltransferase [Ruminococcus sp. OA3]MCH1983258.1 glycosyl transferase [Ruminococcus sp. OA3]
MKVLILSCNTGGGHNSAADAVAEEIRSHGDEAVVLDYLCLAGKKVSHIVGNSYIQIVKKVPLLFGILYQLGMLISRLVPKSPVYYLNGKMSKYLTAYLKEHPVDAIVMPHLYPAETITHMKNHGVNLPVTIALMTDYTCIPFWEETSCDYYVIPDASLKQSICRRGLPPEKLLPFGIPVSRRFASHDSKQTARRKLGLEPDVTYILLEGGSMGAGNLPKFTKMLASLCTNEKIIVVTGRDRKMQKKMEAEFKTSSNIRIIGFTTQMHLLTKACDIVFTKPGGLTSTEAAVSKIPVVHTKPIPGCETVNRKFFLSHGMSISAATRRKQIVAGLQLLKQPDRISHMLHCQSKHSHPDACSKIYHFLKYTLSEEE